ncbi:MAG: aminodeoxychorismate synthase component I [Endomicrobiales bacterium]|nr:aminodeoxychorismate synthase component I [Endomicrobiales bacterium]
MKQFPEEKTNFMNFGDISEFIRKKNTIVFLDTALYSEEESNSYLFVNPIKEIVAKNLNEIDSLLKKVKKYADKYWLSGYLSYEAAYAIENKLAGLRNNFKNSLPLAWFGVFEKPYIFSHKHNKWNKKLHSVKDGRSISRNSHNIPLVIKHTMDYDTYVKKIRAIRNYIAKGDTYQVNFTYDVDVKSGLPPFELYNQLRSNQPTKYCAFIKNKFGNIMSFSPELFFKKESDKITVKPMKGTASRKKRDNEQIRKFEKDKKNNAENVMIVDLLRNDLGRICGTESIKVSKLFEIETHPTVHQMTSTIQGKMRPNVDISDIIKSLFPSGSVTGAPKIRTMEIIRSLEKGERGVYCGMLGFISPDKKSVFNVPIRTLQRKKGEKNWRYRVGSGIVWNSSAEAERKECETKCSFLTLPNMPHFEIFESMLWDGKKFLYLKDHIDRLKRSAKFFSYPITKDKLCEIISKITKKIKSSSFPICQRENKGGVKLKIRIFLNKSGYIRWDFSKVIDPGGLNLQRIILSEKRIDEKNVFLYHKTTYKSWYEESLEKVHKGSCFDVIFCNSKGEVTEGSRSNVFIRKNGIMYTPPVRSGLLQGVLRKQLLRSKKCIEKTMRINDLYKADAVYCGNSVRGLVEVRLKI